MKNLKRNQASVVEQAMAPLLRPEYSIRKTVQLEARIVELEMSLAEVIALAEKNHEIAIRWKTDALSQCEKCYWPRAFPVTSKEPFMRSSW